MDIDTQLLIRRGDEGDYAVHAVGDETQNMPTYYDKLSGALAHVAEVFAYSRKEERVQRVQCNYSRNEGGHMIVDEYVVGKNNIDRIEYHPEQINGEEHYCDVYYKDSSRDRVFNISKIKFVTN